VVAKVRSGDSEGQQDAELLFLCEKTLAQLHHIITLDSHTLALLSIGTRMQHECMPGSQAAEVGESSGRK